MDTELPDLDPDRDSKEFLNIKRLNGDGSKDKSASSPASAGALNDLATRVNQDMHDIKSEMNDVKRKLEQMLAALKAKNQATARSEVLDVKPKILPTPAPSKPVQEKSTSTVEANKRNENPELAKLLSKPAANKKKENAELKRLLEKRPSIPATLQSHINNDSVMGQLAALVKREIVTRESSEVVASKQPKLDDQQPENTQQSSSPTQEVIITARKSPVIQRPEVSFQVGEEEQSAQSDFTVNNAVDQPICFELQLASNDLTNNAQLIEQAFQVTTPATIVDLPNSSYKSRKSSTRKSRKPNKSYKPGMYCFSCLNLITLKTFNWKRQTQCKTCFRQLNFKLCTVCNEWKQHRAAGKCSTCYNSLPKTKPAEQSFEGSSTQPSSVSEISQVNSPSSLNIACSKDFSPIPAPSDFSSASSPVSLVATTTNSSTTPDTCITCKVHPALIRQMCRNCYVDKFKVKDVCRGCKEKRHLLSMKKQLCRECLFKQRKRKSLPEVANIENIQTDANTPELNVEVSVESNVENNVESNVEVSVENNVQDKQAEANEKLSESKINSFVAEILNGNNLSVETKQLAPENVQVSMSSTLKSPKRKQKQSAEDECTIVATVEYQNANGVPKRKPKPFRRSCKKCKKAEILDKFGLCQLCFYSHFNSGSSRSKTIEEPRPEWIVCFSCDQTKLRFCGQLCSECFINKTSEQEVASNKPIQSIQPIQQTQPIQQIQSIQPIQQIQSKQTEDMPGLSVQKARDQLTKSLQRRLEQPIGHYTNQLQVNRQHDAHQQPNQPSELARILQTRPVNLVQNRPVNLVQKGLDDPAPQKRGFRLFNCTGCNRFVKYFAKDLCQNCYQRQRAQKRKEQQQEVTQISQSAEDNQLISSVMTHFYPHASFPLVSATRSFAQPVVMEPVYITEKPTLLALPNLPIIPNNLPQSSTVREELYCICRQKSQGAMILCDNQDCSIGWYHFACVNLSVGPPVNAKWYCSRCKPEKSSRFQQAGPSNQNALVNNVNRRQSSSTNLSEFLTNSLQKLINEQPKKVDLVCLSDDED